MPFAYYDHLSAARKKIYRRSDQIASIRLPEPVKLRPLGQALRETLAGEDRLQTERICQALADGLTKQLEVDRIEVLVLKVRPSDDWGELQGLYEPSDDDRRPQLSLWMRTAQRRQVVAYRTFLRTLLHELCHHLDYELFGLEETFHTEGFYKRESSLFHQLVPTEAESK